jgi:hypothetical protein
LLAVPQLPLLSALLLDPVEKRTRLYRLLVLLRRQLALLGHVRLWWRGVQMVSGGVDGVLTLRQVLLGCMLLRRIVSRELVGHHLLLCLVLPASRQKETAIGEAASVSQLDASGQELSPVPVARDADPIALPDLSPGDPLAV